MQKLKPKQLRTMLYRVLCILLLLRLPLLLQAGIDARSKSGQTGHMSWVRRLVSTQNQNLEKSILVSTRGQHLEKLGTCNG